MRKKNGCQNHLTPVLSLSFGFVATTTAGATVTIPALRATDTLFAALLGPNDIPHGKTNDQQNHCSNNIINHITFQ